jgi:predicted ATPase
MKAGSISFGPFRLFPGRRLLLEGERPVRLGSRAFELLLALVEEEGELVSKESIIRRVWPETFVEEANLRVHVAALRKALGDGQEGNRYIANIPGRGYRFIAATHRHEDDQGGPRETAEATARLPAPLARMVGRAAAMDALAANLDAHRIVSIVGPGGIGKTTVAVAVGGQIASRFNGGVCFVELASLTDAALVPTALGTALGLPINTADATPAIVAYLRPRQMLLVLDSCEVAPDRTAALAEEIAAAAPGVHILTTSREPLRAEGEQVFRIPPLEVPASERPSATDALDFSAVQLLVERIAAGIEGYQLSDEDAPIATDICRRLDGIPLAIELAAGRVGALGLGAISALLDDRFRLVMRGRRTALPRHQTLAATLDWSYDALREDERQVLRRLAVCAGSFSLDAAAVIASAGGGTRGATIEIIADLVAKSLVTADVSANVAMYRLGETMRTYAMEKLIEAGETDFIAARHAAYLRDAFDASESEWDQPSASFIELHRNSLDDVRAALDWAFGPSGDLALGIDLTASVIPLWMHLSLMDECQRRVERAISSFRDADAAPRREMQLYGALGLALMFTRGAVGRTVAALTRSYDIATNLGQAEYAMRALWGLWVDRLNNGAAREARDIAQRFLAIAGETHGRIETAIGQRMLGFSLHFLGRQVEAQEVLERMLAFDPGEARRSHPRRFQFDQWCTARATYAEVLWLRGFPERALREALSSVAEAEAISHVLTLCNTLAKSCAVALLAGDLPSAGPMIDRLREESRVHELSFWQVEAECLGAVLALKADDLARGVDLMRRNLHAFPGSTVTVRYVAYLGKFADALSRNNEFDEAAAAIGEALSRTEGQDHWWRPELLRVQAEVMLRRGAGERDTAAAALLERSLDLAREQAAASWQLRTATSMVRNAAAIGGERASRDALEAIYRRFAEGFGTADLRAAAAVLDR